MLNDMILRSYCSGDTMIFVSLPRRGRLIAKARRVARLGMEACLLVYQTAKLYYYDRQDVWLSQNILSCVLV